MLGGESKNSVFFLDKRNSQDEWALGSFSVIPHYSSPYILTIALGLRA